jgi:hypothetical protein
MKSAARRHLGNLRRRLSRNEAVVRWLGLSRCDGMSDETGLILVQIDGLARRQFEQALKKGRLPFLRKLIRKRGYQVHSMYSGLPSSTPAVQGEIFYGIRCAVPAFGYRDAETSRVVAMFDNAPAVRVQRRLESQGRGLLAGGSAYSNIYSGGAAEPHFCASTFGWGALRRVRPVLLLAIILLYAWSIMRMVALALIEFVIALGDALHGKLKGHTLWHELRFIPSRVGVSIALRELIAIGASLDVTRGLPIVQMNFLGYDEQSHRRGPSSAFAHWTLKGIDDAIKRVWIASHRSQCRRYELWVYSDHGQSATVQYTKKFGRSIQEAVAELFGQQVHSSALHQHRDRQRAVRSQWLKQKNEGRRAVEEAAETIEQDQYETAPPVVEVVSLGPVGHVYPAVELPDDDLHALAPALAKKCGVPAVVVRNGEGKAIAWTNTARYSLPEQSAELFGADHPFLSELGDDIVCLAHHPCAGQFMLLGWEKNSAPMSFASENGSHAGAAPDETHAFLLLPAGAPLPKTRRNFYRPGELRDAVLEAIGWDRREIDGTGQSLTTVGDFIEKPDFQRVAGHDMAAAPKN